MSSSSQVLLRRAERCMDEILRAEPGLALKAFIKEYSAGDAAWQTALAGAAFGRLALEAEFSRQRRAETAGR
jgi:hypothetical protein